MSTRSAPVIGISSYRDQARWGSWDLPAVLLPASYVDAVRRAGGAPILLPSDAEVAEAVTARIDALILAGGADVDPALYRASPHPMTDPPQPDRDRTELAYLQAAMARGLPVLGICRGLQVINVSRGGTLIQHLPDVVGHDGHSATGGSFVRHAISVPSGSRLAKVLGTERLETDTHHHQAVGQLGGGLVATAWADDGTVEAAEDPDRPFVVAVQWHPEVGGNPSLFEALVAAASGTT